MNFTTAYNYGARFAFIRASRTDTIPDSNVAVNVPNAKAAGLVVGVYHRILPFTVADDSGPFVDPIADADNFVASGGSYMGIGYIRPPVDVETGATPNNSAANCYTPNSLLIAFANRMPD